MKILTRQEFLVMSPGTVYSDYKPCIISDLNIKGKTIIGVAEEPIDFYYQSLIGNVKCDNSTDETSIMVDSEENKTSFNLDFNVTSRDGLFDDKKMYAIYEQEDINGFIKKLKSLTPKKEDKVIGKFFCGVSGGFCIYETKNNECKQESSCINKITKNHDIPEKN